MVTVLTNVNLVPVSVGEDKNNISKQVHAVTPGGKEILIYQIPTGYWAIKFRPGGQLPAELSGKYTQHKYAAQAVKQYLLNNIPNSELKSTDAKSRTKSQL
jgi:hypothetical protein